MDNLLRCIAVLCEHERLNLDRNLYVQSEHKKYPPPATFVDISAVCIFLHEILHDC